MTMQFHFRHLSDLILLHTNPCLSAASQNNILKFRLVLLYHAQSLDTITLTEKDLPVFLGGLRLSTKSTVRILHPPLPCCHTGNGYVLESGCALTRAQGCRPGPAIHKTDFSTREDLPVFPEGLRLSIKSGFPLILAVAIAEHGNGCVFEECCVLTRAQGCRPGPAIHKNRFFDKRRPPGISRKVFTIFMQSNIYQQCAFSRLYFSLRSS